MAKAKGEPAAGGTMDVGLLRVDHPTLTASRKFYEARHPEAQAARTPPEKWLVGEGKTPEDACRDLVRQSGKKFKAYHRGPSKHVGGGAGALSSENIAPGDVHHEAEGNTPQEAGEKLVSECIGQAEGCKKSGV